ncbi:MAG: transglycosylase SLT domain-containing protein [Bacteroidales bacterium]|nr:transglycosylase SLT domain-containing protein [Bacteroidales bacterium]
MSRRAWHKILTKKWLRVAAIMFAALLLFYLIKSLGIIPDEVPHRTKPLAYKSLTGDTLNCTILIDKNLNTGNAALKFATDLVKLFAKEHHCQAVISIEKNLPQEWEALTDKGTDIIIYNSITDSIPTEYRDYLASTIEIESGYRCATRYDEENILANINYWLQYFKPTSEYKKLYARLQRASSGRAYNMPITRHSISPYDNIIKKHAASIGWDWRLLSALIYKESGFNTGIVSSMGAIGLMQVLQSTANAMGVEDVYDPEQNIIAGCRMIKQVQKRFKASGMDDENVLLFTLAAYNAGEGRIQQCQKVAVAEGKNPLVWEDVASVIPLMEKGYNKADVKVSSFKGANQVLGYASKVLEQYDIYKRAVDP